MVKSFGKYLNENSPHDNNFCERARVRYDKSSELKPPDNDLRVLIFPQSVVSSSYSEYPCSTA